jgi:hypothetical protein
MDPRAAEAGKPGWVYRRGHARQHQCHLVAQNQAVCRLSLALIVLLQRGQFVGDVLYYYGDGGYKFVQPRKPQPGLGRGYDYDFTNSDVVLNRLAVRDGRFVLPDGTSYSVLVLPEDREAHPACSRRSNSSSPQGAP